MAFSYFYNPKYKYKYANKIDELIINYNPKDTTLYDFLVQHMHQRIVIRIKDEQDFVEKNRIDFFEAFKEKHPNADVVLMVAGAHALTPEDSDLLCAIGAFPRFFEIACNTWDMFYHLLHFQATDIYVTDELGFELKRLRDLADIEGVKIRCIANVAQSTGFSTIDITKFFIRPEDICFYDEYVDVFELIDMSDVGEKKVKNLDTYFKIYAIDKKWFGNLEELIYGYDDSVDSRCIPNDFAEFRVRCGKKCLKGNPCRFCHRIQELSDRLSEKGWIINR